jgi:hypothetical protein
MRLYVNAREIPSRRLDFHHHHHHLKAVHHLLLMIRG